MLIVSWKDRNDIPKGDIPVTENTNPEVQVKEPPEDMSGDTDVSQQIPSPYSLGNIEESKVGPEVPLNEIDLAAREYAKALHQGDHASQEKFLDQIRELNISFEGRTPEKLLDYIAKQIMYSVKGNPKLGDKLGVRVKPSKKNPGAWAVSYSDCLIAANSIIFDALNTVSRNGIPDRFSRYLPVYVKGSLKSGVPSFVNKFRTFLSMPESQLSEQGMGYEDKVLDTYKKATWGNDYETRIPESIKWWNAKYKELSKVIGMGENVPEIKLDPVSNKVISPSTAEDIFRIMQDKFRKAIGVSEGNSPDSNNWKILLERLGIDKLDMLVKGGKHYLSYDMINQPKADEVRKAKDYLSSSNISLDAEKEGEEGDSLKHEISSEDIGEKGESESLSKPFDPMRILGKPLDFNIMGMRNYKDILSKILGPDLSHMYIYDQDGQKVRSLLGLTPDDAKNIMDIIYYMPDKTSVRNKLLENYPNLDKKKLDSVIMSNEMAEMMSLREVLRTNTDGRNFHDQYLDFLRRKNEIKNRIEKAGNRWTRVRPTLSKGLEKSSTTPEERNRILEWIAKDRFMNDPVKYDIAMSIAGNQIPGIGKGFMPLLSNSKTSSDPRQKKSVENSKHNQEVIERIFNKHKESLLPKNRDISKIEERGRDKLSQKINEVLSEILGMFFNDHEYKRMKEALSSKGITNVPASLIKEIKMMKISMVGLCNWRIK